MAKSLKLAMQRESGYKQLKRYLSLECGMSEKIRVKISDANIIWIQTIKAIFVFGISSYIARDVFEYKNTVSPEGK